MIDSTRESGKLAGRELELVGLVREVLLELEGRGRVLANVRGRVLAELEAEPRLASRLEVELAAVLRVLVARRE